ncbi:MAG: AraC family transcriptional regulator [Eubacteriales bacterium]
MHGSVCVADFQNKNPDEIFRILEREAQDMELNGIEHTIHMEKFSIFGCKHVHSCVIYNGTHTAYHNHDFFEINYVFNGRLLQYISGEKFIMTDGQLLLLTPETRHTSVPMPRTYAVNLLFSVEFIEGMRRRLAECRQDNYLEKLVKREQLFQIFNGSPELEPLVRKLVGFVDGNRQYGSFRTAMVEIAGAQVLTELTQCERTDYTAGRQLTRGAMNETQFIEQVFRFIDDRNTAVTLEQIAKRFGYSERQIARLVEKHCGKRFGIYLRERRAQCAERLLASTKMPIAEIAATIGFDSPEYFSRWYRHWRGRTPSAYRRRYNVFDGDKSDGESE